MGNNNTDNNQETRIEDVSRRGDAVAFYAAIVRIYAICLFFLHLSISQPDTSIAL